MKHLNIKIKGDVQGVFFRDSALKKANDLDIGGFVRNEPDGTVYIEAEGDEELLMKFVEWCNDGPPLANVERVDTEENQLIGFQDFRVE